MNSHRSEQHTGNVGFPTTRWSLIGSCAHEASPEQREALVELLQRYLPPIRSYLVHRKRISADQVDDVIQDFLADKILEQEIIGRYQRERGKFRTFLLTALDRFLVDRIRHAKAAKRSKEGSVSLEQAGDVASHADVRDSAFDAEWARQVFSFAIERLKAELLADGRADVWEVFDGRILRPLLHDQPAMEYEELASRRSLTPNQAANLLVTAKRSFNRALRSCIAEYELDEEEIDEEIATLQRALAHYFRDMVAPEAHPALPGQYRIEGKLGEGGTGNVWKAFDDVLARPVAIKTLKSVKQSKARLLAEARAAARLNHPNIVTIHQVLELGEDICLVLELLPAGSLAQELKEKGRLPWRDASLAIRDAAAGLSAAHAAGLVHRDIKPGNLLRSAQGAVKIVDFGLAAPNASDGAPLKRGSSMRGTPAYMSPEQCRGEELDARSDLYSLTCTYFELLTGRPPFAGKSPEELFSQHLTQPLPDAHSIEPVLPESICRILEKGSQKDRARRFQSAQELADALNASLANERAEPTTNLPEHPTSFIGRQRDLQQAIALLEQTRLLTLIGPGGTGKTRLSLRIGSELLARYPQGVWFVELARISDGLYAAQEVATVIGVREQAGSSILQTLLNYLRDKSVLILLDNCEHLVEAAARLTEQLLSHCPKVRVIATSRERLATAGEAILQVPPLSLPDPTIPAGASDLMQSEAIQLFVDRARAIQPAFTLNDANGPSIASISQRLDGIPLAIELAAARVRMLSVEQIHQRLEDRFNLLSRGHRTALPRHQTLHATVDWSYQQLSPAQATLFRRLAIFAGGWTLDDAEVVASDHPLKRSDILNLLSDLVDKSLVVTREYAGELMRYDMLQTMRAFAAEQLGVAGEQDATAQRHAGYFLTMAEQSERELHGPAFARHLENFKFEQENLRAAMDWTDAHAQAGKALRIAAAMGEFWWLEDRWEEGCQRLVQLLSKPFSQDEIPLRVKALAHVAWLFCNRVRDDGWRFFEEAEALWPSCSDSPECIVFPLLYARALTLRDVLVSAQWYERALEASQKNHWPRAEARALQGLAATALREFHFDQAEPMLRRSLSIFREIGDHIGLTDLVANELAWITHRVLRLSGEFRTWLDEASARISPGDVPRVMSLQLRGALAAQLRRENNELAAERTYLEILAEQRHRGQLYWQDNALEHLGEIYLVRGDFKRARECLETYAAMPITAPQSSNWYGLLLLADLYFCLGEFDRCDAPLDGVVQWFEKVKRNPLKPPYGWVWGLRALLAIRRGHFAYARECLAQSVKVYRDWKELYVASCLVGYMSLSAAEGDLMHAARLLGGVEKYFYTEGRIFPAAMREAHLRKLELESRMHPDDFARSISEGSNLTYDQVIEHALE